MMFELILIVRYIIFYYCEGLGDDIWHYQNRKFQKAEAENGGPIRKRPGPQYPFAPSVRSPSSRTPLVPSVVNTAEGRLSGRKMKNKQSRRQP
jgi:hypothetical protein